MSEARIACVGAGFVGLETALSFVEAGHDVVAVDTDPDLVAALERGETPAPLADDADRVADAVDSGRLRASTTTADAADADVYVISVPTPVTADDVPDLSAIRAAGRSVGEVLDPGNLVVQQSTVYPGGCRDLLVPVVEAAGLTVGDDVGIAYVPERYSPGDAESKTAPRVVGAVSDRWRDRAADLYKPITDRVVPVSTLEVAECVKQLENIQRDVNIALINEAHRAFGELDVDTTEVLDAADTKWNFHRYDPGIGVGGHCIPVDPYYFLHAMRERDHDLSVIPAARSVNESMPAYYCRELTAALRHRTGAVEGARVAVLGVTYKPGVRDTRNSPALELAGLLADRGASVGVYDPLFDSGEAIDGWDLHNGEDLTTTVEGADCIVVGTPHDAFADADLDALATEGREQVLVDPYRVFDPERVRASGFYRCPGTTGARDVRAVGDD